MKTYPNFKWGCRFTATYTVWDRYALTYTKVVHSLPACDISSRNGVFPSYEQPVELAVSFHCN